MERRIIKPEDFPIEMNDENIEILAYMMNSFPPYKNGERFQI
jgi:hypothetical protein